MKLIVSTFDTKFKEFEEQCLKEFGILDGKKKRENFRVRAFASASGKLITL